MPKTADLTRDSRTEANQKANPGAYLKDPTGCIVFVSTKHDKQAVKRRLDAGWSLSSADETVPEGTRFEGAMQPCGPVKE